MGRFRETSPWVCLALIALEGYANGFIHPPTNAQVAHVFPVYSL